MSIIPTTIQESVAVIGYYVVQEAIVSTSSTIKVQGLTTIAKVVMLKMSDWSALTTTSTGNTITVTSASLTNIPVIILSCGTK